MILRLIKIKRKDFWDTQVFEYLHVDFNSFRTAMEWYQFFVGTLKGIHFDLSSITVNSICNEEMDHSIK